MAFSHNVHYFLLSGQKFPDGRTCKVDSSETGVLSRVRRYTSYVFRAVVIHVGYMYSRICGGVHRKNAGCNMTEAVWMMGEVQTNR